jgi:hypothetical protein
MLFPNARIHADVADLPALTPQDHQSSKPMLEHLAGVPGARMRQEPAITAPSAAPPRTLPTP